MDEVNLPAQTSNPDATLTPGKLGQLPAGLHVGYTSDVGQKRERNEDSLQIVVSHLQHDLGLEPFGLFIVADGMGGHQKGELASALAARVAASILLKDVYLPFLSSDKSADNRPLNEALQVAVEQANKAVIKQVPDGGTTIVLALVMGNNAYIAHVGDSRAYVLKQGALKQITEDHSLAKKLEQMGQSAEEVQQAQSVLYRAIGQGESIDVDTRIQHLPPGSSLLLCSDGLWGMIDDSTIKSILDSAASPQAACNELIAAANAQGGRDNITAIVVSMGLDT